MLIGNIEIFFSYAKYHNNRVLVMGNGKVLEFDKPQDLIDDEKSQFHKLWMEYEHGSKTNL